MAGNEAPKGAGFGQSTLKTASIANGQTTHSPIDMGRQYAIFVVRCEDASNVAATTALTIEAADLPGDAMCFIYDDNDPGNKWSKGNLPTSGTLRFRLDDAWGARYLRFTLSAAASGGSVVFKVRGFDPVAE